MIGLISNGAALYKITNPNGKCYFGITNHLRGRFARHLKAESAVGHSLRKYGPENHLIEVLLTGRRELISRMEKVFIEEYGTIGNDGLNSTTGGDNEYLLSDETKEKIRLAHIGRVMPQSTRDKISAANKGKPKPPRSEVHKKNLGAAHRGKTMTAEQRAKISLGMSTKEVKEKMSASQKSRPRFSDETKEKLRQASLRVWAERRDSFLKEKENASFKS